MEFIVIFVKIMLESVGGFIQIVWVFVVNFWDFLSWLVLVGYFCIVLDFIKKLIISMRDKVLGQLECEVVIVGLNSCLWDLDQVFFVVVSQQFVFCEGIF